MAPRIGASGVIGGDGNSACRDAPPLLVTTMALIRIQCIPTRAMVVRSFPARRPFQASFASAPGLIGVGRHPVTKNRSAFLDLYKIHIPRNALRFFMTSTQELRRPRATGAEQNGLVKRRFLGNFGAARGGVRRG